VVEIAIFYRVYALYPNHAKSLVKDVFRCSKTIICSFIGFRISKIIYICILIERNNM